jgi:hypothetical protein
MPFAIAKVLYWIFLSGVICLNLFLSLKIAVPGILTESPGKINRLVISLALITAVHFERELHLGQVNQLLLAAYLSAVYFWQKNKVFPSALILAASIFIKPFGFIFVPYFLIKRQFRLTCLFLLGVLVLGLSPLLFYGWQGLISQYSGWIAELAAELGHKQNLLQNGNHTIFSIFARYSPLRLLELSGMVSAVYQFVIVSALAFLSLYFIRKGASDSLSSSGDTALLMAIIPLLAFTSHNAFGFLALLVAILLCRWHALPPLGKGAALCGFVFTGGNIHDLVGKDLWNFFSDISLVSWGTLLLLAVLASLRLRRLA